MGLGEASSWVSGGVGRWVSSLLDSGWFSINVDGGGGKSPRDEIECEIRRIGGGGSGGDGERSSGLK